MSTNLKEISHICLSRVLNRLDNIDHIKNKETTYCEHFSIASSMGFQMLRGGVCLLVHSVFPNYFESSGSDIIKKLYKDL
jgi:hypothetical protein